MQHQAVACWNDAGIIAVQRGKPIENGVARNVKHHNTYTQRLFPIPGIQSHECMRFHPVIAQKTWDLRPFSFLTRLKGKGIRLSSNNTWVTYFFGP
jgi:hypothetical protein